MYSFILKQQKLFSFTVKFVCDFCLILHVYHIILQHFQKGAEIVYLDSSYTFMWLENSQNISQLV